MQVRCKEIRSRRSAAALDRLCVSSGQWKIQMAEPPVETAKLGEFEPQVPHSSKLGESVKNKLSVNQYHSFNQDFQLE